MDILLRIVEPTVGHTETWYKKDENTVLVEGYYPYNYPPDSVHELPIEEALRQFALLMSEGWDVVEYCHWHDFVDRYETLPLAN